MSTPSPAPHLGNPLGDPAGQPGSKAWVEQRYGTQASFVDRALANIIDGLLAMAVMALPLILGIALIIAGSPDTYACTYEYDYTCDVPGSGNGALVAIGVILCILSWLIGFAFEIWNQAWRLSKTGQSLGRKIIGIKAVNAKTGDLLAMGPAFIKALVSAFAGLISAIWMLFDDDERTLSDKASEAAVIKVPKG